MVSRPGVVFFGYMTALKVSATAIGLVAERTFMATLSGGARRSHFER